jgi:hypothetical protein
MKRRLLLDTCAGPASFNDGQALEKRVNQEEESNGITY